MEISLKEPILYENLSTKSLIVKYNLRKFLIPEKSQFLCGDVKMIRHFIHSKAIFNVDNN